MSNNQQKKQSSSNTTTTTTKRIRTVDDNDEQQQQNDKPIPTTNTNKKRQRIENDTDESLNDTSSKQQQQQQSYTDRLILFVGQIPFQATTQQIEDHFALHGAGKVKVRLLTEKNTGKSRGLGFVDVDTPQQLVRALRVHRTRLLGRAINVERTVGGGGHGEKRKEKIAKLRVAQGSKVRNEVIELIDEALKNNSNMGLSFSAATTTTTSSSNNSTSTLTKEDFDDLVIQSLCVLPRDAAKQVLDEICKSDIASARNRKAWILGCIKRYTIAMKEGKDMLTMEEKKAGVIEKKSNKNHHSTTATTSTTSTIPSSSSSNQSKKRSFTSTMTNSNNTSSSSSSNKKFVRGNIGNNSSA
jgi:RNA recognition motif-containing protein